MRSDVNSSSVYLLSSKEMHTKLTDNDRVMPSYCISCVARNSKDLHRGCLRFFFPQFPFFALTCLYALYRSMNRKLPIVQNNNHNINGTNGTSGRIGNNNSNCDSDDTPNKRKRRQSGKKSLGTRLSMIIKLIFHANIWWCDLYSKY